MNDIINKLVQVAKMKLPELDDKTATQYGELYPEWSSRIGKEVTVDTRLWYNGNLWKVVNAHTVQADWTPDTASSLFVKVAKDTEGGTIDNPIHYSVNMELIEGKYYIEDGIVYLCTRSLAQSVWKLADLVGLNVTIV